MAELASVTMLAQPRVSTHLGKLREQGLVRDRKSGVQAYYRLNDTLIQGELSPLWRAVRSAAEDALLDGDSERLPAVLAARAREQRWADAVAGDMERHYSPGRTWEATARALLGLVDLGDVLDVASGDGVLAEMLAPSSKSFTCVDVSEPVVAAGRKRLKPYPNASFHQGDMHALPFEDAAFDVVLLMHALTYSEQPRTALAEAARVLRPQGRLIATTLRKHAFESAVAPYDHANLGFEVGALKRHTSAAGLEVQSCQVTSREARPPHFEVITLMANKP